MINLDLLRMRVDRVLKREGHQPVTDLEWKYAIDERWTEDPNAEGVIDEIVVDVVRARTAFSSKQRIDVARISRGVPAAREYAISLLVANVANQRRDVSAFRQKYLADGLLKMAGVEAWVLARAEPDGEATRWASDIPLPSSADVQFKGHRWSVVLNAEVNFNLEYKELCYPTADLAVKYYRVRDGSALHELCVLATLLSEAYGWSNAEATMFVLTDTAPLLSPCKVSFRWSKVPCLSKITLTVDPAMSPRQVEALYRKSRSQALEGRYRNLTQKHAILAAFTARAGGTLFEQMNEWNAEYSRWKYRNVTNFGRDAKAARDRLLTPANIRLQSVFGGSPNAKKKAR